MANIDSAFRIDSLSLNDNILVTEGTLDPSTGLGYEAPIGSLYFDSINGSIFHKFGTNDTDWNKFGEIDAASVFAALKSPTGFVSREDSQISFNTSNREFTINVLNPATSYVYYIKGIKHTIDVSKSIFVPNTTETYFIYFDGNENLQYQTAFSESLLIDNAIVSVVYWNSNVGKLIYFADERHGLIMDGVTHLYMHTTIGTRWISGLAIDGTFNPGGEATADIQLNITNGSIRDEDLLHAIYDVGGKINAYDLEQDLSPIAQLPIFFKTGSSGIWDFKTPDNFPFIYSGTAGYTGANGRVPYNQFTGTTWQLTELANNHYGLIHILATNDIRYPVIAIHGTTEYQNKPAGVDSALLELRSLTNLPFQEMTPIATLIFQTANSITNAQKLKFELTSDGEKYVDWRYTNILTVTSSGVSDHGNLAGLQDDDHTQYALAGAGSTRTFNFDDLIDINTGTRIVGDNGKYYSLTWDSTNNRYNLNLLNLYNLNDVNVADIAGNDGYILQYNHSTGKWIAINPNFNFLSDVIITSPTLNQSIRFNGTNWVNYTDVPPPPSGSGLLVQVKWGPIGHFTGTTTIPITNSAPLITQGTQIWSQSITPQAATSTIKISTSCAIAASTASVSVVFAVFRGNTCIGTIGDSTANSNKLQAAHFTVYDNPATTSPITYTCRVGKDTGSGTWYINSISGLATPLGGLLDTNAWSIEEIGSV